jgi:hypothetical protein
LSIAPFTLKFFRLSNRASFRFFWLAMARKRIPRNEQARSAGISLKADFLKRKRAQARMAGMTLSQMAYLALQIAFPHPADPIGRDHYLQGEN